MPIIRSISRGCAPLIVAVALGCSIRHPGSTPSPQGAGAPSSGAPSPAATAAAGPDVAPLVVAQTHIALVVDSAGIRRLVAEGMERSHAGPDLQFLTDVIGPRLTGSPGQQRATEWTAHKFQDYNLDSVWTESWRFGRRWERGPLTLTMLSPHSQQLMGVSWAWSPGTSGPMTGDVVYVDARTPAEYAERFASTVKGKWVMTRPPSFVWNSDGPPMSHADSATADSLRSMMRAATSSPDLTEYRQSLPALLARDGALGLLTDGAKEFTLLTMSGSPAALFPLPNIVVPHETYAQFHRLLALGQTVTIRTDIANSLSADTVDAANTIAEIRGATKPDEVVLLGAHLDSWDLATGATDNGTGAIAVLEAARMLKASGLKPARTIRFALFTGEEEGLFGSEMYTRRHGAELRKYQAVLVLDNGTGRITGMSLQGHNELRDAWTSMFAPIDALGPFLVRSRDKGGTDHLSFIPYGVPSFNFDQETRGYNHTHHSQADTYDHAVLGDLRQAATVMAVTAYELATTPDLLGRGPASVVVGSQ